MRTRHSIALRGKLLFALTLPAAVTLGGCAAKVRRDVGNYVSSVATQRLPAAVERQPGTDTAGPPVFTFAQVCDRAAKFDREVAAQLADAARLQIDLEQAHSQLWPRLDLRTYLQVPIGGHNLEDVHLFNGGAFFRYDFQKLFFSGDASAVARAKIEARRESIQLSLQRLSRDLFLLLADREALRAEVAQRRDIQVHASNVLERAHLLERNARAEPQRVFESQYQYDVCTRLYQESVRRLAETNRALGDRLFIDGVQEVVVTDFPELLASMDGLHPARLDSSFFAGLWLVRHDVKRAQADLFVKEMAVVDERRKRIPAISASFGLGRVSLTSSFSQAPFVLQLGASMPVLDFGDTRRSIAQATIERDMARRDIDLLFLQVQRNVQDAAAALSEAVAARKMAEEHKSVTAMHDSTSDKLVALGVADPIDLLVAKMRAGEAEIELKRARIVAAKAAAEYTWAAGLDLGAARPGSGQ